MNVTFLLGNGFDMQLGMKTGYRDFLRWYISQPSKDSDILEFKGHLRNEKGRWWSDAEMAMGEYLGQFTEENISVYYKNIKDFKLRLSEYLKSQNQEYNIADDPAVTERFKDFLLNSVDDIMLRKEQLTLTTMRVIREVAISFVSFNYTDAIDRIANAIKKGGKELEKRNGHPTYIKDLYHVHGTLRSSVIMGVDNMGQLDISNVADTAKLRRTLIKPVTNEELGRSDAREAENRIKESEYVFVYGLSFGETDARWWDIIRKKLLLENSFQVVLFTRSSNEDIQEIIPEDILDYESDKKDDFLLRIGIAPEQLNIVRKKVFIIRNTQRLHISMDDIKTAEPV